MSCLCQTTRLGMKISFDLWPSNNRPWTNKLWCVNFLLLNLITFCGKFDDLGNNFFRKNPSLIRSLSVDQYVHTKGLLDTIFFLFLGADVVFFIIQNSFVGFVRQLQPALEINATWAKLKLNWGNLSPYSTKNWFCRKRFNLVQVPFCWGASLQYIIWLDFSCKLSSFKVWSEKLWKKLFLLKTLLFKMRTDPIRKPFEL